MIDTLLLKGNQEYQETMNCWKQYDHVMGILLEPVKKPRKTFLQKFYEGMSVSGRNIDFLILIWLLQAKTRKPWCQLHLASFRLR